MSSGAVTGLGVSDVSDALSSAVRFDAGDATSNVLAGVRDSDESAPSFGPGEYQRFSRGCLHDQCMLLFEYALNCYTGNDAGERYELNQNLVDLDERLSKYLRDPPGKVDLENRRRKAADVEFEEPYTKSDNLADMLEKGKNQYNGERMQALKFIHEFFPEKKHSDSGERLIPDIPEIRYLEDPDLNFEVDASQGLLSGRADQFLVDEEQSQGVLLEWKITENIYDSHVLQTLKYEDMVGGSTLEDHGLDSLTSYVVYPLRGEVVNVSDAETVSCDRGIREIDTESAVTAFNEYVREVVDPFVAEANLQFGEKREQFRNMDAEGEAPTDAENLVELENKSNVEVYREVIEAG